MNRASVLGSCESSTVIAGKPAGSVSHGTESHFAISTGIALGWEASDGFGSPDNRSDSRGAGCCFGSVAETVKL